ncbi:hypothetical protein BDZ94DRAFT_1273036 [Collybia nuda]|uniref:Secreted protein n=1 Tax=Collybia nuda TaxID=64659 RepID=A0A9P6C9N5_9AGAR|nr:hypothetical protein BDZ94DRAFT_1273036 [Collybia nuda]
MLAQGPLLSSITVIVAGLHICSVEAGHHYCRRCTNHLGSLESNCAVFKLPTPERTLVLLVYETVSSNSCT